MAYGLPRNELSGILRRRSLDRKPWLKRLGKPQASSRSRGQRARTMAALSALALA
jgi:hypothetical protein